MYILLPKPLGFLTLLVPNMVARRTFLAPFPTGQKTGALAAQENAVVLVVVLLVVVVVVLLVVVLVVVVVVVAASQRPHLFAPLASKKVALLRRS